MKRDDGMQMPETLSQFFPLVGGLDVESAQLSRRPGLVMGGSNYESASENGYERLGGFERLDGRPRPSDAVFAVLQASVAFTGVAVGNTVTGGTSAATAKVIQLRGTNQLVTTRQVGTFTVGETVKVGAATVGVHQGLATNISSTDDNTFSALAAADYRADIGAVPGSGVVYFQWLAGVCYAFRDNAGATTRLIYKSSSTGWTAVALRQELSFTAGSGTPPAEGATITKGTTSAVSRRVVLQTGTWAAGTAAGRFIIDTVVGGPFTAGAFTAGVTATCSGAETSTTIAPGGRMDFRVYNFTGSTATERLYGCDGVNRGFEFDGNVYVPIVTGMATDTPRHIDVFKGHLFFSFRGSVQHSGIGAPYSWTVNTGAGELATGQDVTGFHVPPGDSDTSALMIYSESRSLVLYGNSSADWKMATFTPYVGAQRWSMQNIGSPVVMDAQGISVVSQSQQFGNFTRAPISNRIRRLLAGKVVNASVVNRTKNRMRLFFSDGTALSVTAVGDSLAFMNITYDKTVAYACEATINGVSRNFFSTTDGYVYEADRGRSFDGVAQTAWMKLAFNIVKSPGIKKRFRWVDVEVKPQSATTVRVQGEYSLGAIDVGLTDVYTKDINGLGGQYDLTNYEECYYDAPTQATVRFRLSGTGTSLSLTFYSSSSVELPHELQSVNAFYTPRRLERG